MTDRNKYVALTQWLQGCKNDTVTITFGELNGIITVPAYAYKNRPAWANCTTQNGTSFQRGWLNAGYRVTGVSLREQWVEFSKGDVVVTPYIQESVTAKEEGCLNFDIEQTRLQKVIDNGKAFYNSIEGMPHHRYLSWEHCHKVFLEKHKKDCEHTIDHLCLHLAWYLASWGMLRGKAFLLQKDYKIHKTIVEIVFQPKWDRLWDISAEELAKKENAELILELSKVISEEYVNIAKHEPSPTLLTKILLGTIGCTPAYDRYFKAGLKRMGLIQSFGVLSLMQVGMLYDKYKTAFDGLRVECSKKSGMDYPPAKILDMCFFESGMEE